MEGHLDVQPIYVTTMSVRECHIYVSDHDNHCTASGDYIRRFGFQGSGDRQLPYPCGVCVDGSGRVVVRDQGNKRVVRYWWERCRTVGCVVHTTTGEAQLCLQCGSSH